MTLADSAERKVENQCGKQKNISTLLAEGHQNFMSSTTSQ